MTTRIPEITRYQDWLQEERNLSFENYDALWRWSTSDLDGFWDSIWSYMGIESASPPRGVLAKNVMPGAEWFPGATLNYATHVLRHVGRADAAGFPAIVSDDERGERRALSWPDLALQVAAVATHLKQQGGWPGRSRGCIPAQHT